MIKVKDVRRHMPLPDGKSVSDWQIHCFLMVYRAMKDAEAEDLERIRFDDDAMDNQSDEQPL